MTRAEVEAALIIASGRRARRFHRKEVVQPRPYLRARTCLARFFARPRLNKTKLAGAKLDRAIPRPGMAAPSGPDRRKPEGRESVRLAECSAPGSTAPISLERALRPTLPGASLVGASIAGANLGADMRNQSMGLMRAVLKSANLERLNARGADLSRVDLEFASLKGADLTGASLKSAQLGGADLTGVTVIGTDFDGADLASAKLIAPIGLDRAKNFDKAKNRDRLIRQ